MNFHILFFFFNFLFSYKVYGSFFSIYEFTFIYIYIYFIPPSNWSLADHSVHRHCSIVNLLIHAVTGNSRNSPSGFPPMLTPRLQVVVWLLIYRPFPSVGVHAFLLSLPLPGFYISWPEGAQIGIEVRARVTNQSGAKLAIDSCNFKPQVIWNWITAPVLSIFHVQNGEKPTFDPVPALIKTGRTTCTRILKRHAS